MWEILLKNVLPAIFPIICGTAFLSFLLDRLKRRDLIADREDTGTKSVAYRARLHERASQKAGNYAKSLSQIVGPCVVDFYAGGINLPAYMGIIAEFLGSWTAEGKLKLDEYPDFLELARHEMELENVIKSDE